MRGLSDGIWGSGPGDVVRVERLESSNGRLERWLTWGGRLCCTVATLHYELRFPKCLDLLATQRRVFSTRLP